MIKAVIATPVTGGVGTVSKPTLRYEVTKHSYGHEGHMHSYGLATMCSHVLPAFPMPYEQENMSSITHGLVLEAD